MKIKLMSTGNDYEVKALGAFSPTALELEKLSTGEVGFVAASIKEVRDAKVGDTITGVIDSAKVPLEGFKEMKPMVLAACTLLIRENIPNSGKHSKNYG